MTDSDGPCGSGLSQAEASEASEAEAGSGSGRPGSTNPNPLEAAQALEAGKRTLTRTGQVLDLSAAAIRADPVVIRFYQSLAAPAAP